MKGRKGPRAKTSPLAIESAKTDAEVMRLRLQGKTLVEIGALLTPPITGQAVGHRLIKLLAQLKADNAEQAVYLKDIQAARIEGMLDAIYEKAKKGDLAAMDRVERLLRREADLHGLDAPKKIAETDTMGNDLPMTAKQQLRARLLAPEDDAPGS